VARVISAAHTPLIKFVMPLAVLSGTLSLAETGASMLSSDVPIPPAGAALAAVVVALFAWESWAWLGVKRVALGDGVLHVSNYRREIVVPLRDVDRISQRFWHGRLVNIHLARDCEFGRRIDFLPKRVLRWLFWTHPIVDRLRDAVAAAKQADGAKLAVERPTLAG
jgi:hypothetical protein